MSLKKVHHLQNLTNFSVHPPPPPFLSGQNSLSWLETFCQRSLNEIAADLNFAFVKICHARTSFIANSETLEVLI